MRKDIYIQLKKIACEEMNVHEIQEVIAKTEKGDLSICFRTGLGYTETSDELFLQLGEARIDKPELLETVIQAL